VMMYEVTGEEPDKLMEEVNRILEERHLIMSTVQLGRGNGHARVQFTVEAKRREHEELSQELRKSIVLGKATTIGGSEFE
jgi:hypothetical protein